MTVTLNGQEFKVSIYQRLSLDVKQLWQVLILLDMAPGSLTGQTASSL